MELAKCCLTEKCWANEMQYARVDGEDPRMLKYDLLHLHPWHAFYSSPAKYPCYLELPRQWLVSVLADGRAMPIDVGAMLAGQREEWMEKERKRGF
jgi:hypothetical protein